MLRALERLVPIRTASGEDIRVLVASVETLMNTVDLAGQEIARLSAKKDEALLEMMRQRLKEAREVAAHWKRKNDGQEWAEPRRPLPAHPARQLRGCCGWIRPVEADGSTIELRCNECGAVVAVVDRGVLEDLVWLVNATKVH